VTALDTSPSALTHLQCSNCGKDADADRLQTVCPACGKVLFARYDLDAVRRTLSKAALAGREPTLWRYRELLPVRDRTHIVSLGEGMTPLIPARRLGASLGCPNLLIKEEGVNPTGSFKARGQAVAVSRARELGATSLAVPSAGNAGGALAAYAARAGLPAYVFMPTDAPDSNKLECALYGARLYLVRGLINDCGRIVREGAAGHGWFDVSTLREPYRQEGKKTMGYELAEQLEWELPDALIYPTGGGTGIVGMWKAFDEMERLGWIGPRRPKMIAVQAAGCAPIVRAFERGERAAELWTEARTVASGMRVPVAIGDYLMLDAIRESGGTALTVDDAALLADMSTMAQLEGISAAPEGAATLTALRLLLERGFLGRDERVVLFNTGAAWKYTEVLPRPELPVLDPTHPDVQRQIA
jgi:threonine synthase